MTGYTGGHVRRGGMAVVARFADERAPTCTACGAALVAGAWLGAMLSMVDSARLYCTGCGRMGVYCECQPVAGYRGLGAP